MDNMAQLPKLQKGKHVAVLSPSFAAPAVWPRVYELGLERVRNVLDLEPVAFPATAKLNASPDERSADLVAAFEDPEIKAVITTIGGDDQVTYIENLPSEPFVRSPKPFFGFSDNTHFANFLFLNGIPSFYGGSLFTQYAMQTEMDVFTIEYLNKAFFERGEVELKASETYNDEELDWNDLEALHTKRKYEKNEGWFWSGDTDAQGLLWGGCVESVDEMLRYDVSIPTLEQFSEIILMLETSEEMPSADQVRRVFRALGERGILERVKGILMGRPKAWRLDQQTTTEEKAVYKEEQRSIAKETVQIYNATIPIVQNLDFGHTDPQIPMPYGNQVRIDATEQKMFATF